MCYNCQQQITCEVCDNLDGHNNRVRYAHLSDGSYDFFRCEEHRTTNEEIEFFTEEVNY